MSTNPETQDKAFIHPQIVSYTEGLETAAFVSQWRTEGYALIDGLLPADLVDACKDGIQKMIDASPHLVVEDFGGFSFPFKSKALNEVVLHSKLLELVKVLLQDDILLIQGEAWLKRHTSTSPLSNQDQRMHMDYPNHTLLHPAPWHCPEVVSMILYLDDHDQCGGETALVAKAGPDDPLYQRPYVNMPGVGPHRWMNDCSTVEEYFKLKDPAIYEFRQKLYAKECYAAYRKGTVLIYRHDVWHRGTPIKPNQTRAVLNLAYKRASATWITCWSPGWATGAYDSFWGIVPTLNEDQQAALGIPRRSAAAYWQEGDNEEVYQARYKEQKSSLSEWN